MNIRDFVLYLGQNPYKGLAAKQNADAVMEEAGLSQEHQAILKSGDIKRIVEAIRAGETPLTTIVLG
jgi:hypothetical protein